MTTFHSGDKVRCIEYIGPNQDKIVKGGEYTVIGRSRCKTWIILEEVELKYSDDGWHFDENAFELISSPKNSDDDWDRAMSIL